MNRYVEVPASAMFRRLEAAGFRRTNSQSEVVYARPHNRNMELEIRVYTSFTEGRDTARECDSDAIRVSLVWRPKTIGICKFAKILRTGTVEKVIDRTIERAREAYAFANSMIKRGRCQKCGAPRYGDSGRCIDASCRNLASGDSTKWRNGSHDV